MQEFALRLLSELCALYNPLTCDEARNVEVDLGLDLREGGYGCGRFDVQKTSSH